MRTALTLLSVVLMLGVPAVARASSVAYIADGEVWVSSLDGISKVRLASPVVNSEGVTEKWLAVAASDGGRIVATRNVPGRQSSFSWFKVWEPDGSSTVEGPLNALGGWSIYVHPLSFDITSDGQHMVYGYSNSGFCCPQTFQRGTYVRPVTNSPLPPISLSGYEWPTLYGSRVIARSGSIAYAQKPGTPYGNDFDGWLDLAPTQLDLRRTDVAANGTMAAFEVEQWQTGTQTVGKIGVLSTDPDGNLPGPVDCYLPAAGVANDVSLSQDARSIAWTDDEGLKVAGTPVTAADPCELTAPAVVIAPGGTSASIGGGNIAPFLPPVVTTPPPGPPTGGTPTTATPPAPLLALPAKLTAKAVGRGLAFKVTVGAPGKVTAVATVGGKRVGTGSATANAAGKVTIKLKLTKAGRKLAGKGKKLTIKVTQAGRSVTKTVKLS